MWALGWGMGLCSLLPSLWLKKPVMVAWSTPGAALLATAARAAATAMADAVGAFIVLRALMTVAGATGWFERVMRAHSAAAGERAAGRRAGAFRARLLRRAAVGLSAWCS